LLLTVLRAGPRWESCIISARLEGRRGFAAARFQRKHIGQSTRSSWRANPRHTADPLAIYPNTTALREAVAGQAGIAGPQPGTSVQASMRRFRCLFHAFGAAGNGYAHT